MECRELVPVFRQQNIDLNQICECSALGCTNTFTLKDGVAFLGRAKAEDETRLFFFCSNACYLQAMPPEACWQA